MNRPGRGAHPRLGFFGRLGSGNYGNDGSFQVLLEVVRSRHPLATIDAMCTGPRAVRNRYGVPASAMHWDDGTRTVPSNRMHRIVVTAARVGAGIVVDAWRITRWVHGHDAVIVPGMGTFESTLPVRPWQVPWALFSLAVSGRLLRVPVALVDVGVSPVSDRANRILLGSALRLAAHRSFRDEYSRSAAGALGADTSADEVLPDLALGLPSSPAMAVEREIGLGVIAWYGATRAGQRGTVLQARYEETLVEVVRRLLECGYRVRVLAGDDEDAQVARRVVAATSGEGHPDAAQVRYQPSSTLTEVIGTASDLLVVVGARFHTLVAGLVAHRPVVAVAYSEKHRVLLEQVGLGEHVHPIGALDAECLVESVRALAADADVVSATVGEFVEAERVYLLTRLDALVDSLVRRDPPQVPSVDPA